MANKLTKSGYESLAKKLAGQRAKREKLTVELEELRTDGDLTENSAYHQMRETVAIVSEQIEQLQEKLADVKIVEKNGNGVVGVGSKLTVSVIGKTKELEIVGAGEADPLKGKISAESPLGQELLDKKSGAKVFVQTPAGEIEYRILKVE